VIPTKVVFSDDHIIGIPNNVHCAFNLASNDGDKGSYNNQYLGHRYTYIDNQNLLNRL